MDDVNAFQSVVVPLLEGEVEPVFRWLASSFGFDPASRMSGD